MMRDLLTSGQFLAPAAVLAHGRPGCAVLDRFAREGTLLRRMYEERFRLGAELVALLQKVTQTRERIAR